MRLHRGFSLFVALAGAACTSPPVALDEGIPDAAPLDAPADVPPLDDGAPVLDVAPAPPDAIDGSTPPFDALFDAPADVAVDARAADAPGPDAPAACSTAGFTRCGDRCVDIAGDPAHCGACDRACRPGANATAECIAGECDRGCARGFGDCDMDPANGCETALDLVTSCGVCGRACAAGMLCVGSVCVSGESTPPPRAVAPLSGVRLGTRRPAFTWALAAGVSGAEVQVCRDYRCSDVVVTATFDGTRGRLSDPLARGNYFWRLRSRVEGRSVGTFSAPWMLRVVGRETSAVVGWGAVPDFNSDGYADLVVGAGMAPPYEGELRLYYGGPTGLSRTVGWVGTAPEAPRNGVGCSISAGDVNGDGLLEVLAGGTESGTLAGRVHAFEGTADGPRTTPYWNLAGGPLLSSLGDHVRGGADFDGDGYGDVLVTAGAAGGTWFYGAVLAYTGLARGAPTSPRVTLRFAEDMSDRRFGLGSAVAGDVNGDGYVDVVGAACDRGDDPGQVALFLGSPTGLQTVVARSFRAPGGGSNGDRFGQTITGAGDVNGDGYGDVLVGAPGLEGGRGGAWLFLGSPTGLLADPAWQVRGEAAGAQVGLCVAGGGDVDGDGFDDIVLVSGTESTGTARVYFGASSGVRAASVQLERSSGVPLVGAEVAAIVGDTNGDGFDEVAIGTPNASMAVGAGYVFRGAAGGVERTPTWENTGARAGDSFARAFAY